MLVHRLQRWPNIKPPLGERPMLKDSYTRMRCLEPVVLQSAPGQGPGAVVKRRLLGKSEITGSSPTVAVKFQRSKIFLLRSLVIIQ